MLSRQGTTIAILLLLSVTVGCSQKSTVHGTATVGKRSESFSHSVSWWNPAARKLTVVFLSQQPTEQQTREIVEKGSSSTLQSPQIELGLIYKDANGPADTNNLYRYYVTFRGFTVSPMTANRSKDWTGVEKLQGTLGKGVVDGRMKGSADVTAPGRENMYTWDLTFQAQQQQP